MYATHGIYAPAPAQMQILSRNAGKNAILYSTRKNETNYTPDDNWERQLKISIIVGKKHFHCDRETVRTYAPRAFVTAEPYEFHIDEAVIDPDTAEKLIRSIYSCELVVSHDNVFKLFYGARHLGIRTAEIFCVQYLNDSVAMHQPYEIFKFARKEKTKKDCVVLENTCVQYLVNNCVAPFNQQDMAHIRKFSLEDMIELIYITRNVLGGRNKSNTVYGESHKNASLKRLFETVVYWVDFDFTQRAHHLAYLVEATFNVRFTLNNNIFEADQRSLNSLMYVTRKRMSASGIKGLSPHYINFSNSRYANQAEYKYGSNFSSLCGQTRYVRPAFETIASCLIDPNEAFYENVSALGFTIVLAFCVYKAVKAFA